VLRWRFNEVAVPVIMTMTVNHAAVTRQVTVEGGRRVESLYTAANWGTRGHDISEAIES
jgi:hypothetical protein